MFLNSRNCSKQQLVFYAFLSTSSGSPQVSPAASTSTAWGFVCAFSQH
jgi:hypothetical protein